MKRILPEGTEFFLKTDSRLVKFLQHQIVLSIKVLAVLMTLMILWSVLDVAVLLFNKLTHPPYLLLDLEDLLDLFGAFLVILIAIEIFLNIILYLRRDIIHVKMVIATALMAIARKVIILDYELVPSYHLFGIAAIIFALGVSYWLSKETISLLSPNEPQEEASGDDSRQSESQSQ